MKITRTIMGMPVTLDVRESEVSVELREMIFSYFVHVDQVFSTYKPESEISRLNRAELAEENISDEVREVFRLAEETKKATLGFFDIKHVGLIDPSGLVKGWAITNAANILRRHEIHNFYIEAGGDIELSGSNSENQVWRVGIRNPFVYTEHVKILALTDHGIATSGISMRGQHIYDPHSDKAVEHDIIQLTVVGPSAYEADRFATAAFAMGRNGLHFIEQRHGFEAFMIDSYGQATSTTNFHSFVTQ